VGEVAASTVATERAQREQQREAWLTEKRVREELERQVEQLDQACKSIVNELLEQAGYHQHHRGEWRKRRDRRE
jgi:hypothetical protein